MLGPGNLNLTEDGPDNLNLGEEYDDLIEENSPLSPVDYMSSEDAFQDPIPEFDTFDPALGQMETPHEQLRR